MTFWNRSVPAGMLAICVCSNIGLAQGKPAIHTIDAPGAGTAAGQGTIAIVVNSTGAVMGQYIDINNAYHGFVRSRQGTYTSFDVPQAGTGAGQGTVPQSMNGRGDITGWYVDQGGSAHGFVRYPDGKIVSFDAPGAGSGGCAAPAICASGTQGASINDQGEISGQYPDKVGVSHGFLRSRDGAIHSFDAPGAGTRPGEGTFVTFTDGINPNGLIAGGYIGDDPVAQSFVRYSDGTFVMFGVPNSPFTDNSGITPDGTVTSFYYDPTLLLHGYIRDPEGTFTFFDVPGGGTGPFQGTEPLNINAHADITGAYIDVSSVAHGFLRYANGVIVKFDAPGAGSGNGQGTTPVYNNAADAIAGYYIDAGGVFHGFLRTALGAKEED